MSEAEPVEKPTDEKQTIGVTLRLTPRQHEALRRVVPSSRPGGAEAQALSRCCHRAGVILRHLLPSEPITSGRRPPSSAAAFSFRQSRHDIVGPSPALSPRKDTEK